MAPPAAASLVVRRVSLMMLVAIAIGVLSVVVGLLVSYHHGTAAGATVAGVAVAQFFLVLIGQELAGVWRRTPAAAPA